MFDGTTRNLISFLFVGLILLALPLHAKELSPAPTVESVPPTNEAESEKKEESEIKKSFKKFVIEIGHFLYQVSQGPRVNQVHVMPPEFKASNFIVRKKVGSEDFFYVEALDRKTIPKDTDIFFAYMEADDQACELQVVSIIENWILVRNKSCHRFDDIEVGHFLVMKNSKNENLWRAKVNSDYLSAWLQYGTTNMGIEGTSYSGKNLRYGVRVAMDLSAISRVYLNYGVGKNDLSAASSGVEGGFQGVSHSSFHVLGRWSEQWQWDFPKYSIVPMFGIGTIFEELRGHPLVTAAGGGPTVGLKIKSEHYRTVLDTTMHFCLITCRATEAGRSLAATYTPSIFELRVSAKSEVLPWPGIGLLTSFEYYSIKANSAYVTSEFSQNRSLSNEFIGFSIGFSYSWK